MKLNNIHGFANINEYVQYKLEVYSKREKNFETLFELMFDESDNVMVERTDGYRILKTTYGEAKSQILETIPSFAAMVSDLPQDSIVGLFMNNSPQWLTLFWTILGAGYRPLLLNLRTSDSVLENILAEHHVQVVVSDSKSFSVRTILADDILLAPKAECAPRPFGTEVLFMSSGTTNHVKLCAYTGENFFYQVQNSINIVKNCPEIARHYEGQLKHLVLLPLYHVFGFIAVYLWFGFFSRTFVFPKDLAPSTIQRTVKIHKVTHLFAVPMVWEAVAKAARAKIMDRGENTYHRFCRTLSLANAMGKLGAPIAIYAFAEVREGLFGESIVFLISGGSGISSETLAFFNGIGYHLANGYGMTEIGITSVETSASNKKLISGSIGASFGNTEYSVSSNGVLMVRGKSRASRIICDGKIHISDTDQWFETGDLARCEKGRYFVLGRVDDLIIGEDGENLNPNILEESLTVKGVDKLCIFDGGADGVTLVASVVGCYGENRVQEVYDELCAALVREKADKLVRRVLLTTQPLIMEGEIKVSRRKLKERIQNGSIHVFDPTGNTMVAQELLEDLEEELGRIFARVLEIDPSLVGLDSHFFRDLGGSSMDYYALLGEIKSKYGVEITVSQDDQPATVRAIHGYLQNHF